MSMNKDLRRDLLSKIDVSPQRLSQRAKRIKNDHGPMSTEDASYVIAHMEGLDLSKYLERDVVDRIRNLVPNSQTKTAGVKLSKNQVCKNRSVPIKIGADVSEIDILLNASIAKDAQKMASIYPKYYVLENSIRILIKRVLEKEYGNKWWKTNVPRDIQKTVDQRRQKESKQPWHGKRGQHEIFYSNFGDLGNIIQNNWKPFKNFFPSQSWIIQKLSELEHPRNVLAHHNPIAKRDEKRIELYFEDWVALLKNKKEELKKIN